MKRLLTIIACVLSCASALASTRSGKAFADIRELSNACEGFRVAYGSYPLPQTLLDELTSSSKATLNKSRIIYANLCSTNDPWGNPYVYRLPGRHRPDAFDLYSMGADGKTDSDGDDWDDISNWHSPKRCHWYYEPPEIAPGQFYMAAFAAVAMFSFAYFRKRETIDRVCGANARDLSTKLSSDKRASVWMWAIAFYYVVAMLLSPLVIWIWPRLFHSVLNPLVLYVGGPFVASLIGLGVYRNSTERALSWILFALAVIGFFLAIFPSETMLTEHR